MPPQLKRPLILLGSIVLIFILARHFIKPEGFGEKGFYRIQALEENQLFEIKYVGSKACLDCHDDIIALRDSGVHETLNCEVCHEPGYKHILSGEAKDIVIPSGREFCGRCHSKNAARSMTLIVQVDLKKHNVENNCIDCHNPHSPWKEIMN
jgi:hypothetical protein